MARTSSLKVYVSGPMASVVVSSVRAAFHYVRSGRTVTPEALPDEDDLIALLAEEREVA